MFGDNMSIVISATLPHSTLSKGHNILAFHRIREAIAAKIIGFHWIKSKYNCSDFLSKHCEISRFFPMFIKLLITCSPATLSQGQQLKKYPSYLIKGVIHTQDFHHLHKAIHITFSLSIIHISTRTVTSTT